MTNIYCTHCVYLLYKLAVIHHENKHELASLRFLKLNLEYQNMKMGRKHMNVYFFSFMGLFYISIMQSDTTVVSIVRVFSKKAAIIIAILSQKALHWQLSEIIPSVLYNCNSEATN